MAKRRPRWLLLLVAVFCCLASSEQVEGGEFLKRLFGRRYRTVCVPCPQPPVKSVCFGTSFVDMGIPVCATGLVATVQYYNGMDFRCAFQIFLGSDCAQGTFKIHVPCDVKARQCIGGKCCEKNDPTKCENMNVLVDVAAVAMPILPGHDAWDASKVPGAKDTYKHSDLSLGFPAPAPASTYETVKLDLVDAKVPAITYKAMKDGKYYVLNRLTIRRDGQDHNFGIGYEVTEDHFNKLPNTISDVSDRLYRGGGAIPPPTNPITPASKAINFGESDGTNWVWNYNVVEFK